MSEVFYFFLPPARGILGGKMPKTAGGVGDAAAGVPDI